MKNKTFNTRIGVLLPESKISDRSESRARHFYWLVIITVSITFLINIMPRDIWSYLWKNIRAQGLFLYLGVIFIVIMLSFIWSAGQRFDVWVFTHLNTRGDRPRWLDRSMLCFTQIGNNMFALILAVIFYFKVDRLLAYEVALGTLSLWLVVEFIKLIFRRTRPYNKLKGIRIVGTRERGHSFPSGHTSQSFFLATLLINHFHVNILLWWTFYLVAFLVGITRIYIGMHYPRDVLGGAVLGTMLGLFGVIVNNFMR